MMSALQFAMLEARIARGKKLLAERGWNRRDPETKEWIQTWKNLCDIHWEELHQREAFQQNEVLSPNRIPGETPDEYVDRMKAKLIQEGKFTGRWAKPFLRAYLKKTTKQEEAKEAPRREALFSL